MEWKPIKGYEGKYEVSRCGSVRKVDGTTLGQWPNYQGYMLVRLSGPRIQIRVHRIVASAFVPNPNNFPVVNHIDCDITNNNAENLEWCTQAGNLKHMDALGRRAKPWLGRRSPVSILNDEQVREIKRVRSERQLSYAKIGKIFGVSKRTAMRCIAGETYTDVQ